MTDFRELSQTAQEYLDGAHPQGDPADDQSAAVRLAAAVATYVKDVRTPGREVDDRVMAALRTPTSDRFWRWFVQPHTVRVRPAVAAAVMVLFLGAFALTLRRPPATPQPTTPTVLVQFRLVAPDAQSVGVVGTFNEWTAMPLMRNPVDGTWATTIPLPRGAHQYLFVIDGDRWVQDPSAHAQVDDGFGQRNSVITVGPRGIVRS